VLCVDARVKAFYSEVVNKSKSVPIGAIYRVTDTEWNEMTPARKNELRSRHVVIIRPSHPYVDQREISEIIESLGLSLDADRQAYGEEI
jgi:hypothetical protein